MPIKVETEVQRLGEQEEIVGELLGVGKLNWEFTTFKDDLRELETSLKVSSTHISNSLDLNDELTEEETKMEGILKEQIKGLLDSPIYGLYKSAKTKHKILVRIIMHYNLQNEKLLEAINGLEQLLIKAYEYGAVRQKIENELQLLKETKDVLKEVVTAMLKDRVDMQTQYFKSLENYNKQIIDITQKVNGLKTETTDQQLQTKLDAFKNELVMSFSTQISGIKSELDSRDYETKRPKKAEKKGDARVREYDDDDSKESDKLPIMDLN